LYQCHNGRVSAPTIACIGGAHLDRHGTLDAPAILGTSNPGAFRSDFGGVARNVAANLTALGCRVLLCSRVGADDAGRQVLSQPVDTSLITISGHRPTATYTAILEPNGELVLGVADMAVYDELTPEVLAPALDRLRGAAFWFLDANLPAATLAWLLDAAGPLPTAVDAVSVAKSQRLTALLPRIPYLFCNVAQAAAILDDTPAGLHDSAGRLRRAGVHAGIVSAGAEGVAVYDHSGLTILPALPAQPVDVTGAGDGLAAGVLYGLAKGLDLVAAARLGLAAAAITVESGNSTAADLSTEALHARA
jgi:pseudouridine kinase